MSEKMLKFVDIDQKNPSKRNESERKSDFNEIYSEFIHEMQINSLVDVHNVGFHFAKFIVL